MKEKIGLTNTMVKSKPINEKHTGLTNCSVREKLNKDNSVLINGMGKENFTVEQSHKGLINGGGKGDFTNNIASTYPTPDFDIRTKRAKKNNRLPFSIFMILIIILATVFISYNNPNDMQNPISIDNNYTEWTNLTDIGFANFGIKEKDNAIYMTLEKENILKGNENITESYLIFVNILDNDGGFHIGYGTYEYYIDIYGYNNSIEKSSGYQFDENKNHSDWNGFSSRYSSFRVSSTNCDDQMEFSLHPIQMGICNVSGLELLIFHYDTLGNYEYSQVIDADVIKQVGLSGEGTRAEPKLSYYHVFEKNELHIVTDDSLAYTSIPYNIRIVKDNNPVVQITPSESLQPSQEQIEPQEYESRDMATTITISYEFWEADIIKQCGGHIYENTVDNFTFSDYEIILYNINKTVINIILSNDFGEVYVERDGTRGGGEIILLDAPINPIPLGIISLMTVNQYDPTEQDITIDGVLDDYAWARVQTDQYYVDLTNNFKIFTTRNTTHVFIGVDSVSDGDTDIGDFCQIYFDTDNDETSSPDVDDKRISIDGAGTIIYYEGDGSIWVSTTKPSGWDAGESTTGGTVSFEFVVPLSDLDENGQFNSETTTIGFGVHVFDSRTPSFASDWMWYPDAYYSGGSNPPTYESQPDMWSDLGFGVDYDATYFEGYDRYANPMSDTITIDGNLDESAWETYGDAIDIECCPMGDHTHCSTLYIMRDSTYLYLGWLGHNYSELGTNDFCQIYFDTDHDRTVDPDTSDKLMQIVDDNTTSYFEGTGTTWGSQTMPTNWAGSNGATLGNISWEARFTLSELDEGGNFSASGETIGFGITVGHTYDIADQYTMGYPNFCEHNYELIGYKYHPESWGDLVYSIPEFSDYIPISIFILIVGIAFIKKRKDKIPSDKGGGIG